MAKHCPCCGVSHEHVKFKLCDDCRERKRTHYHLYARERTRRWNEHYKLAAFDAYGGRFCACCGETELKFLSIDHVNNDGNKFYKVGHCKPRRGVRYHQLAVLGWPNDPPLQVLCMNCNWGKARNGGICPHQCSST